MMTLVIFILIIILKSWILIIFVLQIHDVFKIFKYIFDSRIL